MSRPSVKPRARRFWIRNFHREPIKKISEIRYFALIVLALIASVSIFLFRNPKAEAQTDTFNSSGNWTVPGGVTSAVMEAWGGGGAGGGTSSAKSCGGGAAGGQYSKVTISVTPGDNYTVAVGGGGAGVLKSSGANGGDSTVTNPSSTQVLVAKGGAGGGGGLSEGAGAGSASGGVGDLIYAGGSGAAGVTSAGSGGGGGGAGSTGGGGSASGQTAGTGTANSGGAGAAGVTYVSGTVVNGLAGSSYGGGGSGGCEGQAFPSSYPTGGAGAPGLVTITYTPSSNSPPAAPTLSAPTSGATGIATAPQFQMSTTDPDGDSVKYRLYLYQSDCTTPISGSPFTQVTTSTGWDNGATPYASGATATYTYQGTLPSSTTYCWKADAIDPGGSDTYGSASATQLFTTLSNSPPSTPSLIKPASGLSGVSQGPMFQVVSADADGDYLRYKVVVYNSDCSTNPQTYDETASQSGWANQDQQSFTAYTGSSSAAASRTADFGLTGLAANTTYCWKAAAIDPGGSDTWSSYSSTQLFTTGSTSGSIQINGGGSISGGAVIR